MTFKFKIPFTNGKRTVALTISRKEISLKTTNQVSERESHETIYEFLWRKRD